MSGLALRWRLAAHPSDQQRLDRFECCPPEFRKTKRAPALEAQSLLRALLRDYARNAGRLDWRYFIGEDTQSGDVVAAFVHREAPDFAGAPFPTDMPLRLLCAIGIRHDLHGTSIPDRGTRVSDELIEFALDDACRSVGGSGILIAVWPRRMWLPLNF